MQSYENRMGNWMPRKSVNMWIFTQTFGNWYVEKPINRFFQKELKTRDCILCWNRVMDLFIYVKCDMCKKVIHHNCAYNYIESQPEPIVCPHCDSNGLYYFNYDTFRKL